jgi:hypothetical protein
MGCSRTWYVTNARGKYQRWLFYSLFVDSIIVLASAGHAAMARWTADQGWIVCLGAPMQFAWWDDECGTHFQLDAAARKVLAPKDDVGKPNVAYGIKVLAMEWMAHLNEESPDQVVRQGMPDPIALWQSLSLMQRIRLASPLASPTSPTGTTTHALVPQLERLLLRNHTITERIATLDNGTVIIPAANTTDPTKDAQNIIFMDSFLGGKQLFMDKDGHVEYTLTSPPPAGKYQITCHFVTVHDDKVKPPLLLSVEGCDDGDDQGDDGILLPNDQDNLCAVYSIPLPYTKGMWQETAPVLVDVPTGVTTLKIALSRENTAHGLALKYLKLMPVNKFE